MELLGYLILGVAVAAFGTLVGIGGGLILVQSFQRGAEYRDGSA